MFFCRFGGQSVAIANVLTVLRSFIRCDMDCGGVRYFCMRLSVQKSCGGAIDDVGVAIVCSCLVHCWFRCFCGVFVACIVIFHVVGSLFINAVFSFRYVIFKFRLVPVYVFSRWRLQRP